MKNSVSRFSWVFLLLMAVASGVFAQTVNRSNAAAPAADQASVELDFWKSVERMDTADAYAAYLEAYPNGRFALLARLAMKKPAGSNAQPAAVATPTNQPGVVRAPAVVVPATQGAVSAGGGPLNAWSGDTSGAIPLDAGNRVLGPGVITVGRLGAKKQLPIPDGEWIVLAATDHDSETQPKYFGGTGAGVIGQGSISLTSLTLAQFLGATARSLLVVTFNRTAHDMPRFIWKGAEQCIAAGAEQVDQTDPPDPAKQITRPEYHHTQSSRSLKLCVQLRREPNGIQPTFVQAHRRELNQNLGKLGGRLGAYNTETDVHLVDRYAAYMRITRLDCTEAQQGRPACGLPEIQPVGLATQVTWAKAYAQQAYTGFDRNLVLPELSALRVTGSTN